MQKKSYQFVFATLLLLVLSHYLAVFLHEYTHSFVAWVMGYKSNPLALHYGGTSWGNILLLLHIDQNVNYTAIYKAGHPQSVGWIALSGPMMNAALFAVGLALLRTNRVVTRKYWYLFILLFCLMNLGNIYDYVPIRTFANHGQFNDAFDVAKAFQLSPWLIYVYVGYPLAICIWYFFARVLQQSYEILGLEKIYAKAAFMSVLVSIQFGYFALPGVLFHQGVSYFISATSLLAIPGIIALLWPASLRRFMC